jgi:hypothetical protein
VPAADPGSVRSAEPAGATGPSASGAAGSSPLLGAGGPTAIGVVVIRLPVGLVQMIRASRYMDMLQAPSCTSRW